MESSNINETKNEIRARINELDNLFNSLINESYDIENTILKRKCELVNSLSFAEEDIFTSVLKSHKVLCEMKEMKENEAYGQDPAMYYTLAICGEAGEMGNKIVKALRNGNDPDGAKNAIISELPDIIIYSAVLAHVLNINLTNLINSKVEVVIERAKNGYYGGKLKKTY